MEENLLVLDTGDLLFNVPRPSSLDRETASRKADLLVNAYNEFRYDALNIGINDLGMDIDFLEKMQSQANFPFLSATIVNRSKSLIFQPFTIVKRGGVRIGIVGVTSGNGSQNDLLYLDVLNAASSTLEKIRSKADYFILLASVFNPDASRLRESNPGYDLILRSHTIQMSRGLQRAESGFYLNTGKQGKYLQIVRYKRSNSADEVVDISPDMQRLNFIETRLDGFKKQAGGKSLEEAFSNSSSTLQFIKNMQEQQAQIEERLSSVPSYIALHLESLGPAVQDNQDWLARVKSYMNYYNDMERQM